MKYRVIITGYTLLHLPDGLLRFCSAQDGIDILNYGKGETKSYRLTWVDEATKAETTETVAVGEEITCPETGSGRLKIDCMDGEDNVQNPCALELHYWTGCKEASEPACMEYEADGRTIWVGLKTEAELMTQAVIDSVPELQAALDDADELNVDQEYRLTLLELGVDVESLSN